MSNADPMHKQCTCITETACTGNAYASPNSHAKALLSNARSMLHTTHCCYPLFDVRGSAVAVALKTRRYVERLFQDSGVVELRVENAGRWSSVICHDADEFLELAKKANITGNVYSTLNKPVDGPTTAFKDAEITAYRRILFDFDPIRDRGTGSTPAQLVDAYNAAEKLARWLQAAGWPAPLRASSGNGVHLQYRVWFNCDDDTRELLAKLYRRLTERFSTPTVKFDPTVRNPARICRVYGFLNRKHDPRETACVIPDPWSILKREIIERTVKVLEPQTVAREPRRYVSTTGNSGDLNTLDVVRWFQSHGLYKRALAMHKHAVTCPWVHEHSTPDHKLKADSVIWETTGENWPTFHCSHAHCDGRSIRDVINLWGDAATYCTRTWRASS